MGTDFQFIFLVLQLLRAFRILGLPFKRTPLRLMLFIGLMLVKQKRKKKKTGPEPYPEFSSYHWRTLYKLPRIHLCATQHLKIHLSYSRTLCFPVYRIFYTFDSMNCTHQSVEYSHFKKRYQFIVRLVCSIPFHMVFHELTGKVFLIHPLVSTEVLS